ncbi:MAG: CinA family protein [Methylophilaceae bacterium]|nr:CinA family protein [Methylophilaceae bacterium]
MDDDTLLKLAADLGAALQARGWMLTLAESCTGGMAAQYVTAIPGSSAWFERGFITYSNQAKIELLGVDPDTLASHGAVSEAVAARMAQGALARSHAQIAAAISGIAGPGGGTLLKPVGTVCFGWACPNVVEHETRHFSGDRSIVRRQAVAHALERLLRLTLAADL